MLLSIGLYAFDKCTNLTNVTIDKNSLTAYDLASAFNGCSVSEFNYISYDITYSCDKCTITGPSSSESTDTVSFEVNPDKNYAVEEVLLDDNGVMTVVEPETDGTYSFTMPSNAVAISATTTRVSADITFCSEDGTVLQQTNYALYETPSFDGETPTKAETDGFTYTFAGWTDGTTTFDADASLPAVFDDVVYTAVFDANAKIGNYYLNSFEYINGTVIVSIKQVQNDEQTFDLVDKVISDGEELTNGDQFDLTKGSAIITIKKDYFDTLSEGNHTLTVTFKDGGSITLEYTITAQTVTVTAVATPTPTPTSTPAPTVSANTSNPPIVAAAASTVKVPATGEGIGMTVIIGTGMLLAAFCVAGIVLLRRRREEA